VPKGHGRPKGRKKPKPKTVTITTLAKRADKLWSAKVRSKGYCERCRASDTLQAAHVVSRNNRRLRWDDRNGMSLCARCHWWWHHHPLEASEWFKSHRPEDHAFLADPENCKPIHRGRGDYEDLIAELKA
jgi:hypothetical protein